MTIDNLKWHLIEHMKTSLHEEYYAMCKYSCIASSVAIRIRLNTIEWR